MPQDEKRIGQGEDNANNKKNQGSHSIVWLGIYNLITFILWVFTSIGNLFKKTDKNNLQLELELISDKKIKLNFVEMQPKLSKDKYLDKMKTENQYYIIYKIDSNGLVNVYIPDINKQRFITVYLPNKVDDDSFSSLSNAKKLEFINNGLYLVSLFIDAKGNLLNIKTNEANKNNVDQSSTRENSNTLILHSLHETPNKHIIHNSELPQTFTNENSSSFSTQLENSAANIAYTIGENNEGENNEGQNFNNFATTDLDKNEIKSTRSTSFNM